jgi:hypothetical protein
MQRLIERSVFSDRMVFVRAVHNAKWMSELELQVYDSWFNPIVSALPTVVPDGFIYLRAKPETCLTRLGRRSRSEETGVSLDYLEQLHQMHEDWLRHPDAMYANKQELLRKEGLERLHRLPDSNMQQYPTGFAGSELGQLLQVDSLNIQSLSQSLYSQGLDVLSAPPGLEQQVYFLDRTHQEWLHPSANRIPVLVLDYDQDLDLENDASSRQAYAKHISDYFAWVKQLQQKRSSWQQQLLLEAERDTGLVMPRVRGAMPSQRDIMQELRQKQQELRMASV